MSLLKFEKADFCALIKRTADWMEEFSVAAAAFYFLQSKSDISAEKAEINMKC